MLRALTIATLALSSLACSTAKVRDSNDRWSDGVVVANNLCARDHSVQHTNDRGGKPAWCQMEEVVGSHLPKCVCRSEQNDDVRNQTQQHLREADQSRQVTKGN